MYIFFIFISMRLSMLTVMGYIALDYRNFKRSDYYKKGESFYVPWGIVGLFWLLHVIFMSSMFIRFCT